MKQLSQNAQAILNFIREFVARNNYPPTYEEIRVGLGLSTKSLVDYHLRRLERNDLISIEPGKPRGISLV